MNRKKDSNGSPATSSDSKYNSHFSEIITSLIKNRRHSKARRILATTLAGFVVFTTTYSLILPAISMELEAVDQVGVILPEERLIDEADTRGNAVVSEDVLSEEDGNEGLILEEPASEPALGQNSYEGDGDLSGSLDEEGPASEEEGQPDTQEAFGDGEIASGSADEPVLMLTASAENVNITLTYPQEIPVGSSVAFNPVDSAYYDNYYYGAKAVLEENNDGWEVSEGQFWNVMTVPGNDVEVELDYSELLGASDDDAEIRYALIDWSNEEWHIYDTEQTFVGLDDTERTVVDLNEEGTLDRITFLTNALQNGAAVFGVLSLKERQEDEIENTEDGDTEGETTVAGDLEAEDATGGNAENNAIDGTTEAGDAENNAIDGTTEAGDAENNAIDGTAEAGNLEDDNTEDAQVNDADATIGTAGTDTEPVDETADANEADDAEDEQTENSASSGDTQSDNSIGSEATAGETDHNEVTAAGEESQNVEAAAGGEAQDDETAADEDKQTEEPAAGDEKPAEGAGVSAQNESEDQPQTVDETETADAENKDEADVDGKDGEADTDDKDEAVDADDKDEAADADSTDEALNSENTADAENTDGTEDQEKQEEAPKAEYPSQLFSSTGDVSVYVTAPEGAFPADTTMIVTPVEEEADIENISETITDSSISRIQAVDIAFFDKEKNEIEPKVPIRVRLVADRMKSDEGAVIVHVDDNGSVEEVKDASITVAGSQAYITVKAGEEAAASEDDILEEADAENADNEEDIDEASYEADSEEGTGEINTDEGADLIRETEEDTPTNYSGSENSDESVTGGAELQEDIPAEDIAAETASTEDDALGTNTEGGNIQEDNTWEVNAQGTNVQGSDYLGSNDTEENTHPGMGEDSSSDSLTAEFEADEFSIYAVVYTVDFHYEVDGKVYDFSLPGGGFVSLAELVEALGIDTSTNSADPERDNEDSLEEQADVPDDENLSETDSDEEEIADLEEDSDTDDMLSEEEYADTPLTLNGIEISDNTRRFVADVESVTFSSPQLVDVSRVESDTTVGQIKDDRGLEVQYSADLTEEQIAVINNSAVSAGDWALISMQPFTSEEELTVTMKNGEVFTILVTDAQISKTVIDAKGETWEITVTYGPEAEIPDGARLEVEEILPEDESYQDYYQQSLKKVGVSSPEDPDQIEETSDAETDADSDVDTDDNTDLDTVAETGTDADTSLDNVPDAVEETSSDQTDGAEEEPAERIASDYARIFNIEIWYGDHEIQPAADVTVNIKLLDAPEDAGVPSVVHFAKAGAEVMEQTEDSEDIQFVTKEFSVYSVVYTVDFHWEVDGKEYQLSIPGGGYVTLQQLVEVLGIGNDEDSTNETSEAEEEGDTPAETRLTLADVRISDRTLAFVRNVEDVEFSDPELAWVGYVDEDRTVGELKESNDLECLYSDNLTDEQIEEINAQIVAGGDWALISLKPFTSNEKLTITMKNGDQFVIKVTDAQDPSVYVGKKVIIYDNKEQLAMTSNWEQNTWRTQFNSVPVSDADGDESAYWIIERNNGNYYLKSNDNRYLTIDNNNVGLVNNWSVATPLGIQAGNNPDYRIYNVNNYDYVLTYEPNGDYPGFFSAPGGTYSGQDNTNRWLYIREAEILPDRTGDWLLYFDDDFSEITIHVGETISLRPYNKWDWKEDNVDVQTAHWNIGGKDNNYWNQIDANDNNGDHKESWDNGGTGGTAGFHWTAYVKKDDQLTTHYWAVQGQATKIGDYVLTNTKNEKTITVHVVDGTPEPPKTINKIANIKVNLFDYDFGGELDVGLVDGATNKNLANNGNFKGESVNQMGGSDHFYFLSSGSGDNSEEPWNSYTKDKPNPNIVKETLDSAGYPVLNHGSETSLQYLFDTSQASQSWHGGSGGDGMIAYPDVVGMFQKDNDGYYYYNSNTNYFYYNAATGTSKLYEHTYTQNSSASKGALANDKPIGFFPFHEYESTNNLYVNQNAALNHHVGLSMELEFMLPADKLDDNNEPIIFDFSGDDDLWVFVEWVDDNGQKQSKLLLDLGGVHQPIHGDINFTTGSNTSFMQPNRPYTLKVFYLERGGCDSNCSIRFNLPIIQDLNVAKKLTGLTEEEKAKYRNEEFVYEILVNGQPYNYPNSHNRYEKAILRNADGEDITPENFTITNGRFTLKDGQTLTITYLDRSDTFSVAEVNTTNMENFEVPNAERYYHLEHDASLYEEEITLTENQTQDTPPSIKEWVTPTYKLEDTEKVTFTNTLKEKNLEVEKKWKGTKNHPDSITFTVSATVDDGNGGRTPYAVEELKGDGGTTDKVFTLNDANRWRHEIEHLPVNTPDGKFIFYDINEGQVEGYTLTGLKDITAEQYNYCNVDVVKLWPDSNSIHTEVLKVVLKNSEGKYYAGVNADGEANFSDNRDLASIYELKPDNNYTHRFARVPAGEYTAEQLHEEEYSKGLATYIRSIIQYELENSPIEGPVDPGDKPNTPEIHKRIDALRDGITNPDSAHANEDLTDLYRLYLDYKVKSLQEASGVDLLFVIDHSGSMNNSAWQGNPYRAPAVEAALNGQNGLISEFLDMNDRNQWAAVGFKGPDGASNYNWSLGNPWYPATQASAYNAGQNGSEVLSPGGEDHVFTRNNASPANNVTLANEGANILTNYTAGLWRAEQFLLKQDVKGDGRKKVVVFISDGIPTLHIDCPSGTLQGAGTASGSPYYRDAYGGCPTQTLKEFGYFVNDMKSYGYTFGDNLEFYTIGFGGTMQTESGSQLLNGMLDIAYGEDDHDDHFMTITDAAGSDYQTPADKLKNDLRTIMGMNETFTNIVIQDDLSTYVDLYGLAEAGTNVGNIMNAAKAKVTMAIPDSTASSGTRIITLYENGAPVNSDDAKFTRADGTTKANIIQRLEYDASTKTVKAIFDPEYQAVEGAVYTLSFDVKTTEQAYTTYANGGYDKYTSGEKQGQIITGDVDTDFLGTDPDNATSVGKEGFRSNDEAKASYKHNGEDEEEKYPHPVIQVAAKADIVKIDQTGAALEGAKFNLYDSGYDANKTIEENANCLIEADLQSKKPADPAGEDAVICDGKLTAGTYYLVETMAPNGYNSLPGPVKITVTETNGAFNMTAEIAGVYVGNDKLVRTGNGNWKLSIQNSAGIELPHTGGPGTDLYFSLGMLMLFLAGGGALMLNRRKIVLR